MESILTFPTEGHSSISGSNDGFTNYNNSLATNELIDLQAEVEYLRSDKAIADGKLRELEKSLATATTAIKQLWQQSQLRHNEMAQLESRLNNEKHLKEKLEEALAVERQHLIQMKVFSITSLQTRFAEKASELVKERAKTRDLQKKIDVLLEDASARSNLQLEVKRLEQQLVNAKQNEHHQGNATNWKSKIQQLQESSREMEKQIDARRATLLNQHIPSPNKKNNINGCHVSQANVWSQLYDIIARQREEKTALEERLKVCEAEMDSQRELIANMNERMEKTIEIFPIDFEKLQFYVEESLESLTPASDYRNERRLLKCLIEAIEAYKKSDDESSSCTSSTISESEWENRGDADENSDEAVSTLESSPNVPTTKDEIHIQPVYCHQLGSVLPSPLAAKWWPWVPSRFWWHP